MKKVFLILVVCLCLVSCREDIVIDPPVIEFDYALVVKNETSGSIYVTSDDIVGSFVYIEPQEQSSTIHPKRETIDLKFSGDGTFWKPIKKTITLQKDEIVVFTFKYPE